MVYKWCVVPLCKNTTIKTPNKLFVSVPKNPKMREKWLTLARRNPNDIMANSNVFCCEDHFDLPNDMENYMEYKILGSVKKVRMKSDCVPTKFECHALCIHPLHKPEIVTQKQQSESTLYSRKYISFRNKPEGIHVREEVLDEDTTSNTSETLENLETSNIKVEPVDSDCSELFEEKIDFETVNIKPEPDDVDYENVEIKLEAIEFEENIPGGLESDIKLEPSEIKIENEKVKIENTELVEEFKLEIETPNIKLGPAEIKLENSNLNSVAYENDTLIIENNIKYENEIQTIENLHSEIKIESDDPAEETSEVTELNRDETTQNLDKIFPCAQCQTAVVNLQNFQQHNYALLVNDKIFKCEACSRKFIIEGQLRKLAENGQLVKCHICPATFINETHLKTHEQTHVSHNFFKCRKCDKRFEYFLNLRKHEKTHPQNKALSKKRFRCRICTSEFLSAQTLRQHQRSHFKDFLKERTDGESCNENTEETSCVQWELKETEDGESGMNVELIELEKNDELAKLIENSGTSDIVKTDSNQEDAENPTVQFVLLDSDDSNKTEQVFECEICSEKFTDSVAFKNHRQLHENPRRSHLPNILRPREERYNCAHCPNRYTCLRDLQQHKLSHPTYQCNICLKLCYTSYILKKHLKVHENKPFPCEKCSKVFYNLYNLRAHEKIHEEKQFQCETCSARFKYYCNLKEHEKTHRIPGV